MSADTYDIPVFVSFCRAVRHPFGSFKKFPGAKAAFFR
jgi:hypothetical protein